MGNREAMAAHSILWYARTADCNSRAWRYPQCTLFSGGLSSDQTHSRTPPPKEPNLSLDPLFGRPYCAAPSLNGLWLSLVERFVRDEEAAGSNPASPTISRMVTRA